MFIQFEVYIQSGLLPMIAVISWYIALIAAMGCKINFYYFHWHFYMRQLYNQPNSSFFKLFSVHLASDPNPGVISILLPISRYLKLLCYILTNYCS